MIDVQLIEQKIGYCFKNKDLLLAAFTHKSYHGNKSRKNNERLEFLGDSVLGFVVADYFFRRKKGVSEGDMTQQKQSVVSTKPLASAVRRLGIDEHVIQGESLNYSASKNDRLLENLFEALVAAIYLDGGLEESRTFIVNNLLTEINLDEGKNEDYKSSLQIYTQSQKLGVPTYEVVAKTGADHNPQFTISVSIAGKTVAVGTGGNKATASQDAARRALKKILGRKNK